MNTTVLPAVVVIAIVGVLTSAPPALAQAKTDKAATFGPFDAGQPRPVTRQGQKGVARRQHPAVGAADKVPGEGPPPPFLRSSPDLPEAALVGVNTVGASLSSNPLYLAALFYGNVLTKVDGPRCQHVPTCSRFANQAVARHGVVGILMGLDRVIAPPQSSAVRLLPEIEAFGSLRHYDPVENYEIWHAERFTGFPRPTPEQPPEPHAPAASNVAQAPSPITAQASQQSPAVESASP